MIKLTFPKEFMLVKQVHQKGIIVTIGISWIIVFKFQPNACNRCHALLMMSVNPSDIAILNIIGSDYHCVISMISKNEAINLLPNADLMGKSGT